MDVRMQKVMLLCEQYYSKKKLSHAMRVAGYAMMDAQHDDRVDPVEAYLVGLAHDLIEDTECPQENLQVAIGYDLFSSVCILTKDDNWSYENYIMDIIASGDELAFLVKRADMKDHMAQVDTLTDKLKAKYLPVLHYFL